MTIQCVCVGYVQDGECAHKRNECIRIEARPRVERVWAAARLGRWHRHFLISAITRQRKPGWDKRTCAIFDRTNVGGEFFSTYLIWKQFQLVLRLETKSRDDWMLNLAGRCLGTPQLHLSPPPSRSSLHLSLRLISVLPF